MNQNHIKMTEMVLRPLNSVEQYYTYNRHIILTGRTFRNLKPEACRSYAIV